MDLQTQLQGATSALDEFLPADVGFVLVMFREAQLMCGGRGMVDPEQAIAILRHLADRMEERTARHMTPPEAH